MPDERNTSPSPGNDTEILVEDGILPRFGVITFEAVDSDEFRSLKGGSAVRVYLVLSLFADRAMACHPTQRTIAEMAGLRRQTVNAAIKELSDVGLLRREAFTRDGREMMRYTLTRPMSKRRAGHGGG